MKEKMRLALYEIKTNSERFHYIHEFSERKEESDSSYVRISNIVEVEFQLKPDEEIIPIKVNALRAEKQKMEIRFEQEIGKLLSITYAPEVVEEVDNELPL